MIGMYRWETFEVIAAVLAFISLFLGVLVVVTKPSKEREQKRYEEQAEMVRTLNSININMTELNTNLVALMKSDDYQNERLDNHDGRIYEVEKDVAIINRHYVKDRVQ